MNKKPTILIVDDDENVTKSLSLILRQEGYNVDVAATGCDAIDKSYSETFNIVLLDIRLPDKDGIELLTQMCDSMPKARKIIMTGFPSQQNAIAALNKRANAYLIKPVDVDKLLETIREQLKFQEEENKFNELKVAEFIDSRARATTK